MNEQPTLFDPGTDMMGKHHMAARDTELEAAALVRPKSGTQRVKVLEAIRAAGDRGLTDPELAQVTGLYLYSAAPRRVELCESGWVKDSGLRRMTPNGRKAIAWVLTDAAKGVR